MANNLGSFIRNFSDEHENSVAVDFNMAIIPMTSSTPVRTDIPLTSQSLEADKDAFIEEFKESVAGAASRWRPMRQDWG